MMKYNLKINDQNLACDVDEDTPLLWVLRDHLKLTGTKFGCGVGACGACTIHLDGEPVRSCQTPISEVGKASVQTIETIGETPTGLAIQQAWIAHQVPQCGYCQSGQIMTASALIRDKPRPDDEDIDEAMSGNICRCGTYVQIRKAIHQAAKKGAQGNE
ncbi:MAG: (2Fe-2S)-binding protein [Sneathiella sp.]